jgi:hypothetical protein
MILCRVNNQHVFSNEGCSKELYMPHISHGMTGGEHLTAELSFEEAQRTLNGELQVKISTRMYNILT